MGWTEARDQLTGALEALTLSTWSEGLPASGLTNVPSGDATRSRTFWWRVRGFAVHSPATLNMQAVDVSLFLNYALMRDLQSLDAVMMADATRVTDAIIDETNWNRPASTIVAVGQGGPFLLRSTVADGDDITQMEINFTIDVRT
ncbi:MAG: hypothetical protein ACPG6R_11005 [Aequoribacter sp.]|uniref:hypothetical protein n=1 Tax=Aequoribacter sp. TaxID=2847771 RepID=UPI003C5CF6BD